MASTKRSGKGLAMAITLALALYGAKGNPGPVGIVLLSAGIAGCLLYAFSGWALKKSLSSAEKMGRMSILAVAACGGAAFYGRQFWPQLPAPTATSKENPFSVEVRSALVSDRGPLTMFMLGYRSMLGDTASPVFYLAYIQLTNLQDLPSTISDFKIAASKEQEGPWEDLMPIPLSNAVLFSPGIKTPHAKIGRLQCGTYRFACVKRKEDMRLSAVMRISPALESEIAKPIQPHTTVRGWVALDSPRHLGLSPGQIYFRVKIGDTTNKQAGSYVTPLPIKHREDTSMDVNCGAIEVVGERAADFSKFHVRYYDEPYPTPEQH